MRTLKEEIERLRDNEGLIPFILNKALNKEKSQEEIVQVICELNIDINLACRNLTNKNQNLLSVVFSIEQLVKEKGTTSTYNSIFITFVLQIIFTISLVDNFSNEKYLRLIFEFINYDDAQVYNKYLYLTAINFKSMPETVLTVFLDHISQNKKIQSQCTSNIDLLITSLFQDNKCQGLRTLEKILINNPNSISLKHLNMTFNALCKDDLNIFVTRWLFSKKTILCNNVVELISQINENILPSIDQSEIPINFENPYLFITKKIIGWLYPFPQAIINFLISILEHSDNLKNEELNQIIDLIHYPLLLSYPETISTAIENRKLRKNVRTLITKQIKEFETYSNSFQETWQIKELKPYLSQREALYRSDALNYAAMMNEIHKSSPFLSTIPKFTILYGRKAIRLINTKESLPNRIEVPLKHSSVSFEMSSLDYLDPHGLDIMLMNFKLEGCDE